MVLLSVDGPAGARRPQVSPADAATGTLSGTGATAARVSRATVEPDPRVSGAEAWKTISTMLHTSPTSQDTRPATGPDGQRDGVAHCQLGRGHRDLRGRGRPAPHRARGQATAGACARRRGGRSGSDRRRPQAEAPV